MADPDFSNLEQIFTMMTPADLAGKVKLNLGGVASELSGGPYSVLQSIIDNDGRGVLSVEDIVTKKLEEIATLADAPTADDLKGFFDVHSTKGSPSWLGDDAKSYQGADGPKKISSVSEIIGANFKVPEGFDLMLFNSRSPFFNPCKRHTKRVELFLNSMPSTILSQMVPYLDVEFQVTKAPTTGLPYLSHLRFLLGAKDPLLLDDPDKAMLDGHRTFKNGQEFDFAGMEMFTSPQTLVDPLPNIAAPGRLNRYSEIADPFRPFASIESVNISAKPTVGMMTFKKAQLVIKLHDRARLSEISDLIRPQAYGNVTVWLTYGWRAPRFDPAGPAGVPYFDFINNNMLMREAYGVSNCSFSFDQVGQVIINLELFTKGGQELKVIPITDALDTKGQETAGSLMKKIRLLSEEIARYRKRLKLDPPEGINKEIRAYQVLDAAQAGEFPDMKATDVEAAIQQLKGSLSNTSNIDTDAAKKLIEGLKTLYKQDQDKTKFNLKQRINTLATSEIAAKFEEVQTGPDPYLIDESKKAEKAQSPLFKEVKKYQSPPKGKVNKYRKKIVSFGKLFTVFALNCILAANVVEEVQVFFYSLNEQCGPVSGHSIAEFPVDMEVFLDQYRDYVVRRGGESITLDEFLGLVVNAQVLDNRAVGYGLRSYYEPYHQGKDPTVDKNKEKDFESVLSKWAAEHGPFKKPAIEMLVETAHKRSVTEGESDILQQLAYSAKDATPVLDKDVQGNNLRRIMRIHIYDKQVNPYRAAAQLLKDESGTHFIEVPSTDYAKKFVFDKQLGEGFFQQSVFEGLQQDAASGKIKMTEFSNARQIKDQVSKMVPTLTYGANGTTIVSANLSTKAEALLSTVNMMRSNTAKNTAQPNGSGEGGVPLRVIPAQLSMTTLGCPLATMAQMYFIDFNTGTSIDNLYICTALNHVLAAGKFETQWTFGYADAYGVFEGAPNIIDQITKLSAEIPKKS